MFPYTVKYTESDIQNSNLLYKTHQQCQNTLKKQQRQNNKSIFFKKMDFKMISVLWHLCFIYIYIFVCLCLSCIVHVLAHIVPFIWCPSDHSMIIHIHSVQRASAAQSAQVRRECIVTDISRECFGCLTERLFREMVRKVSRKA